MISKLNDFIKNLQNSDPKTKKRWLIGATSITMILVITLWSFHISRFIKDLNAAKTESNQASFTAVFTNGLKIISKETAAQIKNLVGGAESLNLLSSDLNFTLEKLEEIKPKKLP